MLTILDRPQQLCDGWSRREWLRVGGLGAFGVALPSLLQARQTATPAGMGEAFGKAKACIVLFLLGGPPQHETWDPKPDAPAEIRGPCKPIPSSVPGLHVGELFPRTAALAHKVAVLRAMSSNDNAMLALSAVVTREGRVQNVEFLNPLQAAAIKVRPDVLVAMLDAASRAEFEPAQAGGSPVAVSMVWLLASTTVRGDANDVVLVRQPVNSTPERREATQPEPKATTPVVVAARPSTDA